MRSFLKVVALAVSLTMLVPPAPVEARNRSGRTAAIVAAAILFAAASSSDRHHDRDTYRSRYHGQGQYYGGHGATGYNRPVTLYDPYSRTYTRTPADVYRYNSGIGYDRFGAYTYDTGRYNQYSPYGGGCR